MIVAKSVDVDGKPSKPNIGLPAGGFVSRCLRDVALPFAYLSLPVAAKPKDGRWWKKWGSDMSSVIQTYVTDAPRSAVFY